MSEEARSGMNSDDDSATERGDCVLPAELKSIEAALASLTPRHDRLDRDRLMFLAGQALVVDARPVPARVLGFNLESRSWPAAFAAMTAVAAILLVMLVVRSDQIVGPQQRDVAHLEIAPVTRPSADSRHVFSTIDAHRGDIERLLAQKDAFRPEARGDATTPAESRSSPILTPAHWHEVLNDLQSVDSPFEGASNHRPIQGARS